MSSHTPRTTEGHRRGRPRAWREHLHRRRLLYAVLLSALIFTLSSFPLVIPRGAPYNDKVVHGLIYFLLGLTYLNVATVSFTRRGLGRMLLALLAVVLFGVLDEWHQSFVPGRVADKWDVLADTVGGFAALLAALLLPRPQTT
ncbi:MAG: VanZ family protein [Candidatus Lambdaproteobacteria bacterium]|nr:VanZ family protein [Candidatus Lambdaproteobacteria bacterium]